MPTATAAMRVADECWVALARLHQRHSERLGFTAREIADEVARVSGLPPRPGVNPHIYMHNVANVEPNSARYRMFHKLNDGTYRLHRTGDPVHPSRSGKDRPKLEELPSEFQNLLTWYEQYRSTKDRRKNGVQIEDPDPVLATLGAGKHLWQDEGGDAFIARQRRDWDAPEKPASASADPSTRFDRVWPRIATDQAP
jgi:hypothetical protein